MTESNFSTITSVEMAFEIREAEHFEVLFKSQADLLKTKADGQEEQSLAPA
jgi:hypothetical protein